MWLSWFACFIWSFSVVSPLIKAVGYRPMWIDAFNFDVSVCEGTVRQKIDFVVVDVSGVDDGIDNGLFRVCPDLMVEHSQFGLACLLMLMIEAGIVVYYECYC